MSEQRINKSTWEERMAKRAKIAVIKRRLRQNHEGPPECPDPATRGVFCCGFEPVTATEDEWPDIIAIPDNERTQERADETVK